MCYQSLSYDKLKPRYQISVQVSDGVNAPDMATVTIEVVDINNNAPLFTPSSMTQEVRFSKSVPVGFIVANVNASDQDFGVNANIKWVNDCSALC